MTQYNIGDFYPRSGAEIDSSGNVKNDADGLNADGSKNVKLTGQKPVLIQSGTFNTSNGSSQYQATSAINEPAIAYRRFLILFRNDTGQTLSSINVFAPNAVIGSYSGQDIEIQSQSVTAGTTGTAGICVLQSENTPYLFLFGQLQLQFNLAATPTATGTLNWSIYGANY